MHENVKDHSAELGGVSLYRRYSPDFHSGDSPLELLERHGRGQSSGFRLADTYMLIDKLLDQVQFVFFCIHDGTKTKNPTELVAGRGFGKISF